MLAAWNAPKEISQQAFVKICRANVKILKNGIATEILKCGMTALYRANCATGNFAPLGNVSTAVRERLDAPAFVPRVFKENIAKWKNALQILANLAQTAEQDWRMDPVFAPAITSGIYASAVATNTKGKRFPSSCPIRADLCCAPARS